MQGTTPGGTAAIRQHYHRYPRTLIGCDRKWHPHMSTNCYPRTPHGVRQCDLLAWAQIAILTLLAECDLSEVSATTVLLLSTHPHRVRPYGAGVVRRRHCYPRPHAGCDGGSLQKNVPHKSCYPRTRVGCDQLTPQFMNAIVIPALVEGAT